MATSTCCARAPTQGRCCRATTARGGLTDDVGALPAIAASGLLLADDLDRDGDIDAALLSPSGPSALLWNRHRHVAMPAPPQRGQTWTLELWSQPGYGAPARRGFLAIGLVRRSPPVVVQPHGVLWLDLATPFLAAMAPLPAGASPATFSLAFPNVPQIAGIVLHVQGLVEEGPVFASARLTTVLSAAIQ